MSLLRRLFPCSGCEWRDESHGRELRSLEQVIEAKDAEIERFAEREKALLKEIHQLSDKLSAHADVSAHVAAVRAEADLETGKTQRTQTVSSRIPPFANALARGGHLNIRQFRERAQGRVILDPAQRPVTDEDVADD